MPRPQRQADDPLRELFADRRRLIDGHTEAVCRDAPRPVNENLGLDRHDIGLVRPHMLNLDHRHDDLLQGRTAMHELHAAALLVHPHDALGDAHVNKRLKAQVLALVVGEDLRLCKLPSENEPVAAHVSAVDALLVGHVLRSFERTVLIEEAMIRRDDEFVDAVIAADLPDQSHDLGNGLAGCRRGFVFRLSLIPAFVDDIVVEYPAGSILVLGRNNGDIRELAEDTSLKITQIEGETHIIVNKYPDLDIRYLTVHKSKGLEADNVIILNMKYRVEEWEKEAEEMSTNAT